MEATYKVADGGYLSHEPGTWTDSSYCACEACGHSSTVAAFDAAVETSGLGIEAVRPDLFYISTSDGYTYGPYHRESEAQNIIDDIMAVDDRFEADVDTGTKVLSDIISPRRFVLNKPIELKRHHARFRRMTPSDEGWDDFTPYQRRVARLCQRCDVFGPPDDVVDGVCADCRCGGE